MPERRCVEFDLGLEEVEPMTLKDFRPRLLKEWELEFADDEKAARRAPDLAAMFEAAFGQGTGLR